MKKRYLKLMGILMAAVLVCAACGQSSENASTSSEQTEKGDSADAESEDSETGTEEEEAPAGSEMGGSIVDAKSGDEELQSMIAEAADKFSEDEYTDEETGLSVPYDIYLPDDYDAEGEALPMIVFIGDMTTAGSEMDYSLKQGWGGIVWATEEEQAKHESIVVVPVYPETILDDHDGYTTTDYVDLTPRMISGIAEKYHADTNRIYGTGQSMGAMTTLLTAAKNPDLYAAVLIVDGQWDIDELKGLEEAHMIYVAAGGDEKASQGQEDVKEMLDEDGIAYSEISGLDAQADREELDEAVQGMLSEGNDINFITWEAGTVLEGLEDLGEHMASFDYGYKLPCVRNWIFDQSR